MTELPNQNLDQDKQPEQTEALQMTETQQIEQAYLGMEGLTDFMQATLPTLPEDVKNQLIQVMLRKSKDPTFRDGLDEFSGDGFPFNEQSARFLIESNPLPETGETREEELIRIAAENAQQEVLRGNVKSLAVALENTGINLSDELLAVGIDISGEFSTEALGTFLDANAERFLKDAHETSPGTIIAVYEGLQRFEGVSGNLSTILAQYETQYLLAREAISNPDRSLPDIQDVEVALGESDVVSIDGDTIRGSNGEVIDLSQQPATLSLEGNDGLVLPVGSIETPDTRGMEVETSRIELQIAENALKISEGEQKIIHYDQMLVEASSYDEASFGTDDIRARFVHNLIAKNPEFKDMLSGAENTDTGAEFLNFLIGFIKEMKGTVEKSTEVLRAENMRLTLDAGKLALRMQSQRQIASKKIQVLKEKARASQSLMERMGTSRLVAQMTKIYPMITEQQPLHLPNGDIIIDFNPSTMVFQGSFTPSLGDGEASDLRTQEVYAQLSNAIIKAGSQESTEGMDGNKAPISIEVGVSGAPVFRKNGEIVDRMVFDSFMNEQVGDTGFKSRVMNNLFSNTPPTENPHTK